jgi:hypothetical protein
MNSTEFLIAFSIIMMMLSLVSERASNFVKLYFQGKTLYIPFFYRYNKKWITHLEVQLDILAYKQPTEAGEKEREYRLMVINIIIGIVIATLSNANLFEILKSIKSLKSETNVLPINGYDINDFDFRYFIAFMYFVLFIWSVSIILFSRLQEYDKKNINYSYPFIVWVLATISLIIGGLFDHHWCLLIIFNTIGYVLVGLFISLGSKFWHDLLGILFKLKNTQQILSDRRTFTDYDNEEKLLALANTSQYDVAEKLFEQYKNEIAAIDGVVSYGLNTVLDEKTKLFKKIIEVEFVNSNAQKMISELQNKSSIVINSNTFFLKNYLSILYTEDLKILSSIDSNPVCYAVNLSDSNKNSRGSFNVTIIDNKYYAVSNLHVFADKDELKKYNSNSNYIFKKTNVKFIIEGSEFYGAMALDKVKFGNENGESQDFCACEIDVNIFNAYNNLVKPDKLENFSLDKMIMFGSTSKFQEFRALQSLSASECEVRYDGFKRKMRLIKVGISKDSKVNYGDSGSFIYYKLRINNETIQTYKGIIVAKSDNYAYMFRYFDF